MGKIAKLPTQLVNQIAAGEAIERPASVVKELVENSIDAGARHIEVDVEEGGRKLIRVSDDGSGILPDDLELAFESHATSKLRDVEDLFNVSTLGFRGEALASISSIARVAISSREKDTDFGSEIIAEGGNVGKPSPKGTRIGTTIKVENLFFNTPVRRKFMRSDSTEIGHISDVLTRQALAHPEISFSLTHNTRKVFSVPLAENVRERISALFGRDLGGKMLFAEDEDDGTHLAVFVGRPEQSRSTRRMQFFFVNGRPIRDRSVMHAVSEAFQGYLPSNKQGVVFLYIDLEPDCVDVNVHPTKVEVRFKKARQVYHLTRSLIRGALMSAYPQPPEPPQQTFYKGVDDDTGRRERIERLVGEYIHRERGSGPVVQEHLALKPGWRTQPDARPQTEPDIADYPDNFFQVHNSYIILETVTGINIIDQHALHERLLYEDLKKNYDAKRLQTQRLLVPEVLDLEPAMRAVLEENRELLHGFGFEIEDFGQGSVLVSSVPQLLERASISGLVMELLGELRDIPVEADFKGKPLDRLLQMMACKAAVKAGQRLSRGEIIALLEQRRTIDGSFTCPHGRPTVISFSLGDLEKMFLRK